MVASSIVWQGDFGSGVSTGSGVFSNEGVNPCVPALGFAAGVSNQGIPVPQFRLGMVVRGDYGSEFILGKLVLAAATDLLPGQAYTLNSGYTAVLAVLATPVLGAEVVFGQVFANQLAAGTYYIWFQRAGRCAMLAASGSVANGLAETTSTDGTLKFVASATSTATSCAPCNLYIASAGWTLANCTTVNGSPTVVVSSITGIVPGIKFSGTGIPANACVAAIRKVSTGFALDIGTYGAGTYTTLQNATASATNITFTFVGTLPGVASWPTQTKTN